MNQPKHPRPPKNMDSGSIELEKKFLTFIIRFCEDYLIQVVIEETGDIIYTFPGLADTSGSAVGTHQQERFLIKQDQAPQIKEILERLFPPPRPNPQNKRKLIPQVITDSSQNIPNTTH